MSWSQPVKFLRDVVEVPPSELPLSVDGLVEVDLLVSEDEGGRRESLLPLTSLSLMSGTAEGAPAPSTTSCCLTAFLSMWKTALQEEQVRGCRSLP